MADITIFPNNKQYIIPQRCFVCESSEISHSVQFTDSYAVSGGRQYKSINLTACSKHTEKPTEMRMEIDGSGFRFYNLNSSYAQILLLLNLKPVVQEAKTNPESSNLASLARYYIANRKEEREESWIVPMFNELGVGEILAQVQGQENFSIVEAGNTLVALADLQGFEKGMELANRWVWKDKYEEFLEVLPRLFPNHQLEIVDFLNRVLRDNNLSYDVQIKAIVPLASCNSSILIGAVSDEDIDVKVRFDILEKIREQELPIGNPDFIEKFYEEIKNNEEVPKKMRRGAAAVLGDKKTMLVQSIKQPLQIAFLIAVLGVFAIGAFSDFLLPPGYDLNSQPLSAFSLIILYSFGIFIFVFIISLFFAYSTKLKNVKWFQKL